MFISICRFKGMSVDDFLGAGFMQEASDGEEVSRLCATVYNTKQSTSNQASLGEEEEDDEEDMVSENGSFDSIDELEGMSPTQFTRCSTLIR